MPGLGFEDEDEESDSGSDGEGKRAARDRLTPKTQRDYSGYISELVEFACRNPQEFADCMSSPTAVSMPVALKLGKAFVGYLRDKLISWPMDSRPVERRTFLKHYSRSKIKKKRSGYCRSLFLMRIQLFIIILLKVMSISLPQIRRRVLFLALKVPLHWAMRRLRKL
jgi:hypothetical protein